MFANKKNETEEGHKKYNQIPEIEDKQTIP